MPGWLLLEFPRFTSVNLLHDLTYRVLWLRQWLILRLESKKTVWIVSLSTETVGHCGLGPAQKEKTSLPRVTEQKGFSYRDLVLGQL